MRRVRLRSENISASLRGDPCSKLYNWLRGNEHWTAYHASVFTITFFAYAFIHASRKTLSTVKPSLVEAWTQNRTHEGPLFPTVQAASEFLALLDAAFLFAYAVGLFFGGMLGDVYDPRVVLAIGMWLSSFATFAFGYLTEVFQVYSMPVYFALWTSSGLFQSVAWPTEIAIMANWFGHNSRGAVMGLWSACASVGNIIGTLVSSKMVLVGYEYAFAVNSGILFIFTFIVFFNLSSSPRDLRLYESMEGADGIQRVREVNSDESITTGRPVAISFIRACLLPGVIAYSLAYACLKLVNYGFFFWLPYYLSSHFHWPESDADALSTWYDVGGIIAAVVAGAASDRFQSRAPIIFTMLLCSSVSLFVYSKSPPSQFTNTCLLIITGFFVGGPANLISGAVSADLGRAPQIRGNAEALSTVTGIIDGTGSTGAAIGQLLIPGIQLWFGWGSVFYGFIFMTLCTAACIFPLLIKEIIARRRNSYVNLESEAEDDTERLLENANTDNFEDSTLP